MSAPLSPVASALPGRIRLRHPALRGKGRCRDLANRLAALEGIRVADCNPAVGSVLVLYDTATVDRAGAEAAVRNAAAVVLASGCDAGGERAAPPGRPILRLVNRASKFGMMGSLAATLAALAMGKRMHAAAGTLFVALTLVHMAVHRKRLFR